jgi:hypothetical protein
VKNGCFFGASGSGLWRDWKWQNILCKQVNRADNKKECVCVVGCVNILWMV